MHPGIPHPNLLYPVQKRCPFPLHISCMDQALPYFADGSCFRGPLKTKTSTFRKHTWKCARTNKSHTRNLPTSLYTNASAYKIILMHICVHIIIYTYTYVGTHKRTHMQHAFTLYMQNPMKECALPGESANFSRSSRLVGPELLQVFQGQRPMAIRVEGHLQAPKAPVRAWQTCLAPSLKEG